MPHPPDAAVALRCDAGARTGVGHLVRCLALAEELLGRGVRVELLGDLGGLAWAEKQVATRGLPVRPAPADPEALAALCVERAYDAVVLDGYELHPASGTALRARGIGVLAVVDGTYGGAQQADLYLDQNLGAERRADLPAERLLGGLAYALLRDVVRGRRPAAPPDGSPRSRGPVRVLAVFGGTDAYDAARTVVPLLLETRLPVAVTVVAARPETALALSRAGWAPGQQVEVLRAVDDLPALVVDTDVVVSASGTSLWELLCLGAATGVVSVVDNQEVGYQAVLAEGLAAPVGRLGRLGSDAAARAEAVEVLTRLLTDARWRGELAAAGWSRVDGRGRERVADVLLAEATAATTQG